MKYFTPDLILRYGSADDRIAESAIDEWEAARAAYLGRIRDIRAELPQGALSLLDQLCLHDARVIAMGEDKALFSILLQLNANSDQCVQLDYQLASRPKINLHPSLNEEGTPLEWLYDEFDVVTGKAFTACKHIVLFTSGRELQLVFHDLKLRRFRRVRLEDKDTFACNETGELDLLPT